MVCITAQPTETSQTRIYNLGVKYSNHILTEKRDAEANALNSMQKDMDFM